MDFNGRDKFTFNYPIAIPKWILMTYSRIPSARQYEKDGVRHRTFGLRADSIGKHDRAEKAKSQRKRE